MNKILRCFAFMIGLLSINIGWATKYEVTNTNVSNGWYAKCAATIPSWVTLTPGSLQDAIVKANNGQADTIVFAASLANQTLNLNIAPENSITLCANNIVIDGKNAPGLILSGSANGPALIVTGDKATIKNLQFTTASTFRGGLEYQTNNSFVDSCTFLNGNLYIGHIQLPAVYVQGNIIRNCDIQNGDLQIMGAENEVLNTTILGQLIIGHEGTNVLSNKNKITDCTGMAQGSTIYGNENKIINATINVTQLLDNLENPAAGINIIGDKNEIRKSTITNSLTVNVSKTTHGIRLVGSQSTNNIVDSTSINGYWNGVFIVTDAESNKITNNNIIDAQNIGIYIENANNNTLSSNIIDKSIKNGIEIKNAQGNLVEKNVSTNSRDANGISINTTTGKNTLTENAIYSNTGNGIFLYNALNTEVTKNNIGQNSDGSVVGGNDVGISIANGGSGNIVDGNTIVASIRQGIAIGNAADGASSNNTIVSNLFGNVSGANKALENGSNDILVNSDSKNNIIGKSGEGNTIHNKTNTVAAIEINGAKSTGNTIQGNSLSCNKGKGIELSDGGNEDYSSLTSPNWVTVNTAEPTADVISGKFQIVSTGTVTIDIYITGDCETRCSSDATGTITKNELAQGKTWVASKAYTASTGKWSYTFTAADKTAGLTADNAIVTATDGAGNTSEFAVCEFDPPCTKPTSVVLAADNDAVCDGSSITMTATATPLNSNNIIEWYKGNVLLSTTSKTLTIDKIANNGTYKVLIYDIDKNICGTNSNTLAVKINTNPTDPTFTDNAKELCQGTGNSTISVTEVAGMKYQWTAANIVSGQNTKEITVDFTTATNPTVIKVKAIDIATGCESTEITTNVTINDNPTPVINGDATPLCNAAGVIYNVVSANNDSKYTWTIPTGATQVGDKSLNNDTITVDYSDSNGNITVTETNAKGCIGTSDNFAISLKSCGLKADFSFNNADLCIQSSLQNNTVTFTDLSTPQDGSIVSYLWNFGDGSTPSTLGTKGPHDVQYTTIGTKTVELTITDSFGTESKVTYTVNVNDIPTGFTFTDQAKELCQGTGNSTVSVTKIDGLEYTWIADNIISGQKTNEITVDFTNATNPTVIKVFAVNSTTTCKSDTILTNVTINDNPRPVIDGDATPLCNAAGVIYNIVNPTSGSTYTWTVPTGVNIVSGQGTDNITVDYSDSNGNITVTETNAKGCIGTSDDFAISLKSCGLKADFSFNNADLCIQSSLQNNTITFTDQSTGDNIVSYLWNFGNDATPSTLGTKGPHDVQYTTIGTKTVELTITDSFGTESKVTYTVNVNDIPTGFTFTDQAKELCQGTGNSTVSVTKIDGLEYTWIADNIISGQKTNEITVDFTNATNPTVIKVFAVNSTTTCKSDTILTNVTINDNPKPVIDGDATPLCNASGLIYKIVNPTNGSTYTWTVPTGVNIVSGQGTETITVDYSDSNGNITVTETNAKGCIGTSDNFAISLKSCGLKADFSFDNGDLCIQSSSQKNTVTFTDASTGDSIVSYLWNFGNGAIPQTLGGKGPHDIQYTTIGTKTVELTITDNFGTESKATYTVNVKDIPNTANCIIEGEGGCSNTETSFELKEANNGSGFDLSLYDYDWSSDDQITNGQGSTKIDVKLRNASQGTTTVKITDKQTGCQTSKSKSYDITVESNFDFIIAGNETICDGDSQFSEFTNKTTYEYTLKDKTTKRPIESLSDIHPQASDVSIIWKLVDKDNNVTDLNDKGIQQGSFIGNDNSIKVTVKPGFIKDVEFKDYKLTALIKKTGACAKEETLPPFDFKIQKSHEYKFSIKDTLVCNDESPVFHSELMIDGRDTTYITRNINDNNDTTYTTKWWAYTHNWLHYDASVSVRDIIVTQKDTIFMVDVKNNDGDVIDTLYYQNTNRVPLDKIKDISDTLFKYKDTYPVFVGDKDSVLLSVDSMKYCFTNTSIFNDTLVDFTIRRPAGIIGMGTKDSGFPDTTKLVLQDVEEITLKDLNALNNIDNTKWVWTWKKNQDFVSDSMIDPSALSTVHYPRAIKEIVYRLVTFNEKCYDTTYATITNLLLPFVPNVVSPNGDGVFDGWVIHNSANYPEMTVKVFNRWGSLVYESEKGYPVNWTGTRNSGEDLPTGTYFYIIEFNNEVVDTFGEDDTTSPYSTARNKEASLKAGSITIMR